MVPSMDLEYNMLDLEDMKLIPEWCAETLASGHALRMPNPDHELAGGNPIYFAFIDVFGDNVSGNCSKIWNKHWNVYITHQNYHASFYTSNVTSTSTHATVPPLSHHLDTNIILHFIFFLYFSLLTHV